MRIDFRRFMARRRLPRAASACAVSLALGLSLAACGHEEGAQREGLAVDLGGVTYNVYITRQLNPRDAGDRSYVQDRQPPTGQALYGVFLKVCNESKDARPAAGSFKVVDTEGKEYEPIALDGDNPVAYRPRRLPAGECIPTTGSLADTSPTAGALLLFQLPLAATENRPLELEIERPLGVPEGEDHIAIELDI